MNYFLAFFILVFSLNLGQAQSPIFFNEVGVSLLRSTVADVNTIDKFGFGVNLYKIPKGDKISQVVFGMELNQYNQLKKLSLVGHLTSRMRHTVQLMLAYQSGFVLIWERTEGLFYN